MFSCPQALQLERQKEELIAWLARMSDKSFKFPNESDEGLELYMKERVRSAEERKLLLARLDNMRSAYYQLDMDKVLTNNEHS